MNLREKKRIYIIKYIYITTLKNPVSAYLMMGDSRTFNLGYTNGGEDTRISVNSLSNVCRLLYICVLTQFWLILPEATAIGIRLSHAS